MLGQPDRPNVAVDLMRGRKGMGAYAWNSSTQK